MDGNYKLYDYDASLARIDEILGQPAGQFEDADSLPSRDKLTFTNGFYGYCTALFVDIRDSSSLPGVYKRPTLARLYRSFISEAVAILNSDVLVREVNIVGDCVWAIYSTPTVPALNDIFGLACRLNVLENVLALKMERKGYATPIYFGIGLSYGRALMVKAGYKGSTINDVVYMGDVVNQAAHLAARGGKGNNWSRTPRIHMDHTYWQNLNEHNQALTTRIQASPESIYSSDAVNMAMWEWYEQNSK